MIETCSHHDIAELETLIAHLVFNLSSKFHRKIIFGAPEFIPGILWSKCCLIFSFVDCCFSFCPFHLAIVLSVLRFMDSDYPFWYLQTLLMFFDIFIRVIFLPDGKLVPIPCRSNRKDKDLSTVIILFLNCRYLNLAKNSEDNFIEIKYSQVVIPFKFYTK